MDNMLCKGVLTKINTGLIIIIIIIRPYNVLHFLPVTNNNDTVRLNMTEKTRMNIQCNNIFV